MVPSGIEARPNPGRGNPFRLRAQCHGIDSNDHRLRNRNVGVLRQRFCTGRSILVVALHSFVHFPDRRPRGSTGDALRPDRQIFRANCQVQNKVTQTVNENTPKSHIEGIGHGAQGIGKPSSFLLWKKMRMRAKQEKSMPYALKMQHLFPFLNQFVYALRK